MKKTLIFDWSGTLSDNMTNFHQVYELMAKELKGKSLTLEEIRKTFTLPYMKFWNIYFPDLTKERQDILYQRFIHEVDNAKPYPTTYETIKHLHDKGHKIFIVSSDPSSKLIPETKEYEIFEYITETFCNAYNKEQEIKYILDKYNLDKNNTIYIGDTSGDIEAGKIAGTKTIGISWGFQSRDILAKSNPDFLINDIAEIKNII